MNIVDRIDELLLQWDDLRDQGRGVSAEELCRDCPELLDEVRIRIGALEAVYRVPNGSNPAGETRSGESARASANRELPQVAGYEVMEVLGSGGMGTVYKARHVKLNRLVALKMIPIGGHAGPQELARLRAEAEAIARLHHPNIVQIHEVGEHAGLPFLSLEFADGGSLAEHLASGRWTVAAPETAHQAAQLVETVARAMHAAHQQGIVHRDLKPANILLASNDAHNLEPTDHSPTTTYQPKITDFGLAKRLDAQVGLTQTGAVMGTPSYMAPEQAEGKPHAIGPQTDVYALGAILYELLTGQPPFQAGTLLETLEQVRSTEPHRPGSLQPRIPRDLDTICLKCLEKEPRHRYASALELAEDLRRFREGELIHARAFTLIDRVARTLNRERDVVQFHSMGRVVLCLAPVSIVSHTIGFLLIRNGWPHVTALGATLTTVAISLFPIAYWARSSGKIRFHGPALRDFWSNRVGTLVGMVLLPLLGYMLSRPQRPWEPLTTFPLWSLLSGVTVFGMGSLFWGRMYVIGLVLVGLAFAMTINLEWAVLEFGIVTSAIFATIAWRLLRISKERESAARDSIAPPN